MEGISSTPIENSVQFLRLRDKYKSDIFEDSRLTKAAGLAANESVALRLGTYGRPLAFMLQRQNPERVLHRTVEEHLLEQERLEPLAEVLPAAGPEVLQRREAEVSIDTFTLKINS